VIGDTLAEFDDTFFVDLSGLVTNNRAVSLLQRQGVGTIVNDDWGVNLLEDDTLLVIGTQFDDHIDIHIKDPKNAADSSNVKIKTKGIAGDINTGWVASPTGVISRVFAYGLDGKDSIKVDDQKPGVSAWLYGGNGDDKLDAGKGPAVLVGGDGNDDLKGAEGLNILIGGRGQDKLDAGKGNAILIGGSTNFDEPTRANFAALEAVMAALAAGGAALPNLLNPATVDDNSQCSERDSFV
jgi:Ca2+-binding RTX toxin-like protein